MKKIYRIPVTWESFGIVEVEAENLQEAIKYFDENEADIALPSERDYVDGSFRREAGEVISLNNGNEDYGDVE